MRIGKKVWHSKRNNYGNNTRPTYDTPTEIVTRANYLTVMPATSRGYAEFTKYGEKANDTWVAIANGSAFDGFFKVGDLMWVDDHSPDEVLESEYGIGSTANAKVVAVNETNHSITVVLEKTPNQQWK